MGYMHGVHLATLLMLEIGISLHPMKEIEKRKIKKV
jgi:hypothetical protein